MMAFGIASHRVSWFDAQQADPPTPRRVAWVLTLALAFAIAGDQLIGGWLGFRQIHGIGTYRRIGPETGPQVFMAGSSVFQYALVWAEVAESLGQGIENWGVGGSSPEIWEVSQLRATNTNALIVGISVFDMNEYRLSDFRAAMVPVSQTIADVWNAGAPWRLSRRLLAQYAMSYLQLPFPTLGRPDRVLTMFRQKAFEILGLWLSKEERDTFVILPSKPILEFGETTATIADWSPARMQRRRLTLRTENGGLHQFSGPKWQAFRRMVRRAQERGRVFVVVMPVSQAYVDEFATDGVETRFDRSLDRAIGDLPLANVVRLDRDAVLRGNENFFDLVHLNAAGRKRATTLFLEYLATAR